MSSCNVIQIALSWTNSRKVKMATFYLKMEKKIQVGKDKVVGFFLNHSIPHKQSFIFSLKIDFLKTMWVLHLLFVYS